MSHCECAPDGKACMLEGSDIVGCASAHFAYELNNMFRSIPLLGKNILPFECERFVTRDSLLSYKSYTEAQDAYGYGDITEAEFDEIARFLESSQEIVDKPSPEEMAVDILSGWRRIMLYDVTEFEFNLLPEKEQERINEERSQFAQAREERLRKKRGEQE